MFAKNLIPCMYLNHEQAVCGLEDRESVLSSDPVALAKEYFQNGADALLVFDLSDGDSAHEKALDLIKEICLAVEIPVIGAGNVKRMEDIKKLLYAGCKMAALNYSKALSADLVKEVSQKFGKEKIVSCIADATEYDRYKDSICEWTGHVIAIHESAYSVALQESVMPVICVCKDPSIDTIESYAKAPSLTGISGLFYERTCNDMIAVKRLMEEKGIPIQKLEAHFAWDDLKKNGDGMVPVVVQDYKNNEVLMVAYMDRQAYEETLLTGRMTYYSRSRNELWVKGLTSGHFQYVKSLTADCDLDTILAKVSQVGAACHTGKRSCFFNEIAKIEYEEKNPAKILESVTEVIRDRKIHPKEGSYTNYLFDKGIDKILKKLGEEATEIVIAAKNPNANEIKYEISDFLYHMMVLMVEKGVSWEEITEELARR